jgi:hypothetical protein
VTQAEIAAVKNTVKAERFNAQSQHEIVFRVNGTFFLPQPLQARARNAANTGTAYSNVGSSASPLNLLMYNGPISTDALEFQFSQLVNANDALRTGTYSKTLTFTLSATTP